MRRIAFRPLLLLLAVAALLLGACADDGELGGPTVGGSLAAKIGSFEYTSAELEDEVEQWAESEAFLAQAVGIPDAGEEGRRSADLVAIVVEHRVISEQSRQLAQQTGYEPTSDDVEAILSQLEQGFVDPATGESIFGELDPDFRRQLGRDFAYQQNLQNIDPSVVDVPEVTVNPRYGSFLDQDRGIGRVLPPAGPLPATPSA